MLPNLPLLPSFPNFHTVLLISQRNGSFRGFFFSEVRAVEGGARKRPDDSMANQTKPKGERKKKYTYQYVAELTSLHQSQLSYMFAHSPVYFSGKGGEGGRRGQMTKMANCKN